jgi:hypothetical protein
MPTELSKEETKAQAHGDATVMLLSFIACLVALVLLLADKNFAEAVQLLGLY